MKTRVCSRLPPMDQSRQEGKREVELELTLHTYGEINNGHPEVEIRGWYRTE
jgi:hypothetical protein